VHWLVHVPVKRQTDYQARLTQWLRSAAGEILDDKAIHIRGAYNTCGAGRYMLKGTHPAVAAFYGVTPEGQGRVRGKRAGFSRNIGPTQKQRLREAGEYPYARRRNFIPAAA
jgi:hypothetical protein